MGEVNEMNNEEDFIGDGFHRINDKYIDKRPPRITWGRKYLSWTDSRKVQYLEKFARSMNHAAFLVQGERDQLNKLCELKESQIGSLNKAMADNMNMLQHEVTRMNEQRQNYNTEVARLNKKIRELEV